VNIIAIDDFKSPQQNPSHGNKRRISWHNRMKTTGTTLLAASFICILLLSAGCKTNHEAETPLISTVVRLSGGARFAAIGSSNWHSIKLGDFIPSHSIVQTDTSGRSRVFLVLGKTVRPPKLYDPERNPANLVLLASDSALEIEEVTQKRSPAESVEEIRLALIRGRIQGYVKPLAQDSNYRISCSNAVLTTRSAIYVLTASGSAAVLEGSVVIEGGISKSSNQITANHPYDGETDSIREFKPPLSFPHEPWDEPSGPKTVWSVPTRRAF
jgi:hypothetical protein